MATTCPKCQTENTETSLFCSGCGAKLEEAKEFSLFKTETLETALKELSTGSTFAGRYQIIEELGKGGMGKVYKVFDQEVQAKMALKLIRPDVSADKNTIERFRNELKIARDISHKNICRMYDLGREGGNYFITMEYVSGEDLKSFIRRSRQLVVGTAILIARQVCEGLAEAHRAGVVHRDLKPGNIMIDKEGNAKIMDFGVARSVSVKGITGAGVMIGTPEYMSPEQVEGKEVDQRSDIYSLGIILYEMLTGQVPFEGDTPFTIGVKQKSEIPKDPKSLNAQIPPDLSRLILKCLEKDKGRRYQNVNELMASLENIERGIPTAERPIPKRKTAASKPITFTISRKKFFVPLSILAAIAIIAIGLWRFLPKQQAPPPPAGKPTLAILYFENISADSALDDWKTGLTELLITDLAQSKFLNILSGDMVYGILKELNLLDAQKYSTAELVKIADAGGANYTATGSLMKAGDKIVITLTLLKPHLGEIVRPIRMDCGGETEILAKVDELSRIIKSELHLTPQQIAGDVDKEIGTITSNSPEALKYYGESIKYGRQGDPKTEIEFLQKAIAVDPEFAVAYREIAIAYYNLGLRSKEREFIQKAFDLRHRVSDQERYEIEAEYYGLSEKTYDRSIEAFQTLLELFPEYYSGRSDLGWTYYQIEEWDKAIEQYSIVVQKRRTGITSDYIVMAGSYAAKGLYDKAVEILREGQEKIGDNYRICLVLAYAYLCQGRYDLALEEADKSLALDQSYFYGHLGKAAVYCCRGDLTEARKEVIEFLDKAGGWGLWSGRELLGAIAVLQGRYGKAMEEYAQFLEMVKNLGEIEQQAVAHSRLAYAYLKSGDLEKAREEAESSWRKASEAESLEWQRYSQFLRGLISIEGGSLEKAGKTAEELKGLIDSGMNRKAIRYYYSLLGRLELKKKNYPKAIELFNTALSYLPFQYRWENDHALFIEPLAAAYYGSGNLEKSVGEYEKLVSLTVGRLFYGDIYAKSLYMLGQIAELQGDKAKAAANYEKFIDLWKDADPGQPEIEDARKRLARLRG